MAKYSPIGPIKILEQLHYKGLLGNYLLFLAHDVLENMRDYCDLVTELQAEYANDLFIIMDNGTIERGSPVGCHELLEAANLVEANVVVGPDIVGDYLGTKKLMMAQGPDIQQDFPIMMIPQGQNWRELFECVDWMHSFFPAEHRYWGVPRWVTNKLHSRDQLIYDINCHNGGSARIHLLGMSNCLADDIACSKMDNVIGIDSANPLVKGHRNYLMTLGGHIERGDYWECTELNDTMIRNVEWVRNVVSG